MNLPIFIENSKVPIWLSKIVPIDVYALSFSIFVWCRGLMSERTKNHETIHYKQQLEMLFVFQWIFYGVFHIVGLIRYRNGQDAYFENPFEREAYDNDVNLDYLDRRKPYAWVQYIRS